MFSIADLFSFIFGTSHSVEIGGGRFVLKQRSRTLLYIPLQQEVNWDHVLYLERVAGYYLEYLESIYLERVAGY